MEKKPNKFKAWVKKYETELEVAAYVGVTFAVGIGLGYVLGKTPKASSIVIDSDTVSTMDTMKSILPVFNVGKLSDAVRYDTGTVELLIDEIPLEDLGNLGAEITERIPDLPENAKVWSLLSISDK